MLSLLVIFCTIVHDIFILSDIKSLTSVFSNNYKWNYKK